MRAESSLQGVVHTSEEISHYVFSLKRIQSQTVKSLNSSTYITYKCHLLQASFHFFSPKLA